MQSIGVKRGWIGIGLGRRNHEGGSWKGGGPPGVGGALQLHLALHRHAVVGRQLVFVLVRLRAPAQAASVERTCITCWRLQIVWGGDDDAPPSCPHHASACSASHGTACHESRAVHATPREPRRGRRSAWARVCSRGGPGADGDVLVAGRHQAERLPAGCIFICSCSGSGRTSRGPLSSQPCSCPFRLRDCGRSNVFRNKGCESPFAGAVRGCEQARQRRQACGVSSLDAG